MNLVVVLDKSEQEQVEVSFERRYYERERQGPVVYEGDWRCRVVMSHLRHCIVISECRRHTQLLPGTSSPAARLGCPARQLNLYIYDQLY